MLNYGQRILGDFLVEDILSWEGLSYESEVYLVREEASGQLWVAKTRQSRHGSNLDTTTSMQGEGLIAHECQGIKGIPRLHGVWLCHSTKKVYVVMEYIKGHTFDELINSGSLNFSELARLWAELGEILRAMASHKVLHTDLRIENIMIHECDRTAFLCDLGGLRLLGIGPRPNQMPTDIIPAGVTWRVGRGAFQLGFLIQHTWNKFLVWRAAEGVLGDTNTHAVGISGWQDVIAKADIMWMGGKNFMTLDGPAMVPEMQVIEHDLITVLRRLQKHHDEYAFVDYRYIRDVLQKLADEVAVISKNGS